MSIQLQGQLQVGVAAMPTGSSRKSRSAVPSNPVSEAVVDPAEPSAYGLRTTCAVGEVKSLLQSSTGLMLNFSDAEQSYAHLAWRVYVGPALLSVDQLKSVLTNSWLLET